MNYDHPHLWKIESRLQHEKRHFPQKGNAFISLCKGRPVEKFIFPSPSPSPPKKKKIYARFMKHDTENQPLIRPDFSPLSIRPPHLSSLYTPTNISVHTLHIIFYTFPMTLTRKFLSQIRATVDVDHFLYSHDLNF